MANTGDITYRDIPFSLETRFSDFYTYIDLQEIPEKCSYNPDKVIKCRTVGILQSINGRFYLSDFDSSGTNSEPLVQVSMVYLKSPPLSTVRPYPVQVFGTMQWKNRPVIFAKILQTLNTSTALRLKNILHSITSVHLAKSVPRNDEDSS